MGDVADLGASSLDVWQAVMYPAGSNGALLLPNYKDVLGMGYADKPVCLVLNWGSLVQNGAVWQHAGEFHLRCCSPADLPCVLQE